MTATLLEQRVGRKLTAAERHIDVAGIDRLLNQAKDLLDAEIQREQLRVVKLVAAGHTGRLDVTHRMILIVRDLIAHGRTHATNELASMGYPAAPRRAFQAPSEDDLLGRLRARLRQHTVKIQQTAVGIDLSELAAVAVEHALMKVHGARSIAADLIAPAFDAGLSQTFEQHSDLVEAWQYTAVLDAGLCDPCAELDGSVYDTLDALFEVLPDFGGNPDCDGGTRCRCRAVPMPPN